MKKKSLGLNATLNVIKTLGTYIFPFITYPYVFRILQVEGVGKYSYAFSIISYFVLIAGLGTNKYAIREGSKIRKSSNEMNCFAADMIGLSFISTLSAYLLLAITVLLVNRLHEYWLMIAILAPIVAASSLSMDWVLNVYEDFLYVTVRTFIINILSLAATFILVRSSEDLYLYAIIHTVQLMLIAILNILYSRKYIKFSFSFRNITKHLKSIFIFFSMTIAIQIYVNVDTTMLGYIKGDNVVGLYNAANKVYSIMKTAIVAIVMTFVPRMTECARKNDEKKNKHEYIKYLNLILELIIIISVPMALGAFLFNHEIINILSGKEYLDACFALKILSLAMPICCLSTCINTCVLVINDEEKKILYATVAGALLNMIMNLYFIPRYAQDGAAITTLCAELLVLIIDIIYCYKYYKHLFDKKKIVKAILKGFIVGGIVFLCFLLYGHFLPEHDFARLVLTAITSGLAILFCIYVGQRI